MLPPSLDSWTLVFLIAAVQGFFTAFILWHWQRGHKQANRLLAGLLFLFAITLIEYVLYWSRYHYLYPHSTNISVQFPFLFGPMLWLYLRIVYEDQPISRRDGWLLTPFFIGSLLFLEWYAADAATKQAVIAGQATFPWNVVLMKAQFWARLAWMSGFLIWLAYYISRQPQVGLTARWARLLVSFYGVFVVAYVSYFALIRTSFFNETWDYHISAVMTAMIYLIAYSGYVQPAVFDGFAWHQPAVPVKYRNSGLTPEASQSLLRDLHLLMQEECAYQDSEISLDKLAARLQASKHHVSQVINEQMGASFFDYINQLRIEKARQILASTTRHEAHIIEIAYTVGFNNKVSFNTAFKRATGMTPTEFRRSHNQSDNEMNKPAGTAHES